MRWFLIDLQFTNVLSLDAPERSHITTTKVPCAILCIYTGKI